MSREIKFRAWDFECSQMIYAGERHGACEHYFDFENNVLFLMAVVDEDYPRKVQANIMQYTGLKDKNGVEIYEGDVVKWRHGEGDGVGNCGNGMDYIGYNNASAQFGLFSKGEYTHKGLEIFRWDITALEIVGNIHQHPHLLK